MGLPTMPVQNAEIAAIFDQAPDRLEIKGENQFRVRAYRRAARVIEGLPQSVHSLLSAGRDLSELPGIGKDLAGKIANIVKTGRFALLDTLKKQLPGELGDMAALPGLGPKRAKLLCDKLMRYENVAEVLAHGPTRTTVMLRSGLQVDVRAVPEDLHAHSDWTDGTATIEAMAEGARALGYAYIALTDHSRRVAMAHGLDPARLSRQIKQIDRLNERLRGITLLKGIEVDILKDGDLDLPDASLAKLDVVIASVHSHFDLPRQAQTDRVVRAIQNRHVSILGHPTGRLIGEREPFDIDMERVAAAARELGCHLEINAEPDRLHLNDIQAHPAK